MIATESKSDEVAYQTASLYLDAQQMTLNLRSLNLEVESLQRVSEVIQQRTQEGRELPIANARAAVDLARVRQRADALKEDLDYAQASLAVVLGYPAADRVEPVDSQPAKLEVPETEPAALALALENNKDVRRLESQLQAKGLDSRVITRRVFRWWTSWRNTRFSRKATMTSSSPISSATTAKWARPSRFPCWSGRLPKAI